MIDIGVFRLINPPAGQEEIVRAAIEAIDYPWDRLHLTEPIEIEWTDQGMGQISGLYYGYQNKIKLSNLDRHLDSGVGFVLAHEIGHLVDDEGLTDNSRDRILEIMHAGPFVQLGHVNHDHPDAGHGIDIWSNGGDSYISKVYEAFADQFVAAFAPTIWDGSFYEGAYDHHPRFIHWTDNHEAIREAVLWETPPPPKPEPKEEVLSRGAAIDHAIQDLNRWLRTHRRRTPKRLKVLAARRVLRAIRPR